jgi:hypothetical protein
MSENDNSPDPLEKDLASLVSALIKDVTGKSDPSDVCGKPFQTNHGNWLTCTLPKHDGDIHAHQMYKSHKNQI